MGSLKSILVLAVLGGIGYVTFIALNSGPAPEPPPEAPTDWAQPDIQLGDPSSSLGTPTAVIPSGDSMGSSAPPFVVPSSTGTFDSTSPPGGSAPPFNSGVQAPLTMPPSMTGKLNSASTTPASSVAQNGPIAQASMVVPNASQPMQTTEQYAINNPPASGAFRSAPGSAIATDHESAPPAQSSPAFLAAAETAQKSLDAGRLAEAHLELSKWFNNPQVSASDHAQLVELLDQLAGSIIYSREHLLEPAYKVQPGDRLADIARTYQVPTELLAKINGIPDAEQLYPGEVLKVVRGPFKAVVNLDKQELTLMLDDGQGGVGRYAGRFPIDVAGGTMVSEGSFFVQSKAASPHWINLGRGLGIHGASGPADSAGAAAQGGIRLTQQDVNDVYDMLSTGSKVIIRR